MSLYVWLFEFGILYLCAKLAAGRWSYPAAAALFVVLLPLFSLIPSTLAPLLALGQGISVEGFMTGWFSGVVSLGGVLKFIGAWVLFYLLDRYEDREFTWIGLLIVGFYVLIVVL